MLRFGTALTATALLIAVGPVPVLATSSSVDLSVGDVGTSTPVLANTYLTYRLTVSNAGPDPAPDATLTDTIPPDAMFTRASANGTYDPSTQTVTWSLGPLDSGASIEVL